MDCTLIITFFATRVRHFRNPNTWFLYIEQLKCSPEPFFAMLTTLRCKGGPVATGVYEKKKKKNENEKNVRRRRSKRNPGKLVKTQVPYGGKHQ